MSRRILFLLLLVSISPGLAAPPDPDVIPRPLSEYRDPPDAAWWGVLRTRAAAEPFNVAATLIFGLAIIHTFFAARIRHYAHLVEERHAARRSGRQRPPATDRNADGIPDEVSFKGQVLHFLGEVEAIFGIWAVVLAAVMAWWHGSGATIAYLSHGVNFTEPLFVVVIMALAATRPVLRLSENLLGVAAGLGGGRLRAWWLAILILAPLLGSFITEPAAMTIAALLLGQRFYTARPSPRLAYATLGLLFVNISVGGTLTHFAAPPVLMVASAWQWDTPFMLAAFGWKAVLGILGATLLVYLLNLRELKALESQAATDPGRDRSGPVPAWITAVHLGFIAFCVFAAHYPPLFVGAFLYFLAFAQATAHHQRPLELRSPLLVGFFLAGLVVHGGLQGWWIEPTLSRLGELPLFFGAVVLTAFNDNAAITYLATLVPNFTDELKYAVVAGAVCGGGLTVIANAPNPAGQSILNRYFPEGITPLGLLVGALAPTAVMCGVFVLL